MEKRTLSGWRKALAGGLVVGGLAGMLGCQTQPSINPARAEADRQNVPIYVTNPETGEVEKDDARLLEVHKRERVYQNIVYFDKGVNWDLDASYCKGYNKAPISQLNDLPLSLINARPFFIGVSIDKQLARRDDYRRRIHTRSLCAFGNRGKERFFIRFIGESPTIEEFLSSEEWRTKYKWEYEEMNERDRNIYNHDMLQHLFFR